MLGIGAIYTYGVLPMFERERHEGLGRRLKQFKNFEWMQSEELKRVQWQKLSALLLHAYNTSPFYRRRFQSGGFDPSTHFTLSDLSRVPMLTRDDIRVNLSEMYSRKYALDDLAISATGGTTDTPVKFYRDRESVKEKIALQWQLNSWAGMYPGDKVYYLWGARSDYAEDPSWRWKLYDQHLMRRRWAPTSIINGDIVEQYRKEINRFKPSIIYAYPTPLALLCEHVNQSGKSVYQPKAVICTAESLLDKQREIIEATLGCRVFMHYGAREFGMIASECEEHSGLHFASTAAFVEFLPVGNSDPGACELLVTDLLNYGMPLIRYRVNDCVVVKNVKCRCGRGYPIVQSVIGRTSDVFRLPNGNSIPGVALTNRVLHVCPGLRKIQIIQDTADSFTVRFVRGDDGGSEGIATLEQNLKRFFPLDLRWTFEEVQNIEREPSGKTRFCISRVKETPSVEVR